MHGIKHGLMSVPLETVTTAIQFTSVAFVGKNSVKKVTRKTRLVLSHLLSQYMPTDNYGHQKN